LALTCSSALQALARRMALNWESTYAVAIELERLHPDAHLPDVTLGDIYEWTMALPDFEDDPALCNDEILTSIYQEWYEVTVHD
jgi:FeS assembly protein IscX